MSIQKLRELYKYASRINDPEMQAIATKEMEELALTLVKTSQMLNETLYEIPVDSSHIASIYIPASLFEGKSAPIYYLHDAGQAYQSLHDISIKDPMIQRILATALFRVSHTDDKFAERLRKANVGEDKIQALRDMVFYSKAKKDKGAEPSVGALLTTKPDIQDGVNVGGYRSSAYEEDDDKTFQSIESIPVANEQVMSLEQLAEKIMQPTIGADGVEGPSLIAQVAGFADRTVRRKLKNVADPLIEAAESTFGQEVSEKERRKVRKDLYRSLRAQDSWSDEDKKELMRELLTQAVASVSQILKQTNSPILMSNEEIAEVLVHTVGGKVSERINKLVPPRQ